MNAGNTNAGDNEQAATRARRGWTHHAARQRSTGELLGPELPDGRDQPLQGRYTINPFMHLDDQPTRCAPGSVAGDRRSDRGRRRARRPASRAPRRTGHGLCDELGLAIDHESRGGALEMRYHAATGGGRPRPTSGSRTTASPSFGRPRRRGCAFEAGDALTGAASWWSATDRARGAAQALAGEIGVGRGRFRITTPRDRTKHDLGSVRSTRPARWLSGAYDEASAAARALVPDRWCFRARRRVLLRNSVVLGRTVCDARVAPTGCAPARAVGFEVVM